MNRDACNQSTRHINISSLARRLDIPMLACYGQSPESVAARPRWLLDLLGTARRALAGLPPCRQSTNAAELYHVGCSTFFRGRAQQEHIRCCVALSGDDHRDVRLTFRLAPPNPKIIKEKNSAN